MARPKLQVLVIPLLVALCSSTVVSAAPLSDTEIAAMLDAHNTVRRGVVRDEARRQELPADLGWGWLSETGGMVSIPDLTWDPAVAAIAQEYADYLITQNPPESHHCDHPDHYTKPAEIQHCKHIADLRLGENLSLEWSTGTPDQSPGRAVDRWESEKIDYNYKLNKCAEGKECGHYTQLVWSSTERLGCGRAVRTTNDGRTYVIWVCNYAPAGNIRGQRPYNVAGSPPPPDTGGQLGGHTTRHIIEVRFTKMRVHNCNEGGICDWRITCRLGNQPGTVLLNNVEADDLDEPVIDKALTQEGSLPVTIECKAEEHDGGIDPRWEDLGTRSLTIQQAGENVIRIAHLDDDGDVDEGDVSIFFDVQTKLQIGMTGQPPILAPPTLPSDKLMAMRTIGIDFSVPEADLRQWLNNSEFTPYPALAEALLKLLEGKRLRQPVFIDVIRSKYEDVLSGPSPRSVVDVDFALLRAAILQAYNERYGEAVTDFERLVDIFIIADLPLSDGLSRDIPVGLVGSRLSFIITKLELEG